MKQIKIILVLLIVILLVVVILRTIIQKRNIKEFEITEEDENYIPSEEEIQELEEGYGDDVIITPNPDIESY